MSNSDISNIKKLRKDTISQRDYKPEYSDENYKLLDQITSNIIETMTLYKNKEKNKIECDKLLLGNLSLLFSKKYINNKEKTNNYNFYIPTKRIYCLNKDYQYNEKEDLKENIKDDNANKIIDEIFDKNNAPKVPGTYEHINFFHPLGKTIINDITKLKNKNIQIKSNKSINNSSNNINNLNISDSNENALKNNISMDDSLNELSNNNTSTSKNNETEEFNQNEIKDFNNYLYLDDYIECPLEKIETDQEEYNEYLQIFQNFNNKEEYNIDEHLTNTFVINDFFKTLVLKDNNKDTNNNSLGGSCNISEENSLKSLKALQFHQKEDKQESSNSLINMQLKKSKVKKKCNDLTKLNLKKYTSKMSKDYIIRISYIYNKIIKECDKANDLYLDKTTIKKLFIQCFKIYLLRIGISSKKQYVNMVKKFLFIDDLPTFDQFIENFDSILFVNSNEEIKQKFLFLINICSLGNERGTLNNKDINTFLNLVMNNAVYLKSFSTEIKDKLMLRYKAFYKEEENNIKKGKYILIKMMVILDSFFREIEVTEDED